MNICVQSQQLKQYINRLILFTFNHKVINTVGFNNPFLNTLTHLIILNTIIPLAQVIHTYFEHVFALWGCY